MLKEARQKDVAYCRLRNFRMGKIICVSRNQRVVAFE